MNQYSLPERLKLADSVTPGFQQVSFRPLHVFVGEFSRVPVAPERFQRDGSHQVCEYHLEKVRDLVSDRLGVS